MSLVSNTVTVRATEVPEPFPWIWALIGTTIVAPIAYYAITKTKEKVELRS